MVDLFVAQNEVSQRYCVGQCVDASDLIVRHRQVDALGQTSQDGDVGNKIVFMSRHVSSVHSFNALLSAMPALDTSKYASFVRRDSALMFTM